MGAGLTFGIVVGTEMDIRNYVKAADFLAIAGSLLQSDEILKSGYDFCTLYTDLSNPTSNAIYMKIGFQPVCDSSQYTFLR